MKVHVHKRIQSVLLFPTSLYAVSFKSTCVSIINLTGITCQIAIWIWRFLPHTLTHRLPCRECLMSTKVIIVFVDYCFIQVQFTEVFLNYCFFLLVYCLIVTLDLFRPLSFTDTNQLSPPHLVSPLRTLFSIIVITLLRTRSTPGSLWKLAVSHCSCKIEKVVKCD